MLSVAILCVGGARRRSRSSTTINGGRFGASPIGVLRRRNRDARRNGVSVALVLRILSRHQSARRPNPQQRNILLAGAPAWLSPSGGSRRVNSDTPSRPPHGRRRRHPRAGGGDQKTTLFSASRGRPAAGPRSCSIPCARLLGVPAGAAGVPVARRPLHGAAYPELHQPAVPGMVRNQASEASRWLPAVVPVVPYNGTAPEPATARAWRAPARRRRGCGCARRGVPGTVPPPGL